MLVAQWDGHLHPGVVTEVSHFSEPSSDATVLPHATARMRQLVVMVRDFLRDHPELNRLIAGRESSDRQIMWAILDAIDVYNTTPPFLQQASVTSFPSLHVLLRLATANLLESVALLQARNHLNFSDGGISYAVQDKHQLLMSWAQMFRNAAELRVQRMKRAMNIELAMGGAGAFSEYAVVNGLYLPGW